MSKICINQLCENHQEMPSALNPDERVVRIATKNPLSIKEIYRHLYANPKNGNEFYFCGVCHHAIEMSRL